MQIMTSRFRSSWGMIYLAATTRGLAAVQLGGSAKGMEAGLMRRFPGATILANENRYLAGVQRQLQEYFLGRRTGFPLALDWTGLTDFQRRVLCVVNAIPFGQTRTYGEVARLAGRPGAARAAGGAVGANPLAPIVPCHRVLPAAGGLGGYSGAGGTKTKKKLLEMELNRKPSRF